MKKYLFLTIITLFIFMFSFQTFAHSGRTDSNGGHYDHSDGSYHYHHGEPAHDHPNGECPYVTSKENKENKEKEILNRTKIISLCITPFMALFPTAILLCIIMPFFDFLSDKIKFLNKHYDKIQTCLYVFFYIVGVTLWVALILNTC